MEKRNINLKWISAFAIILFFLGATTSEAQVAKTWSIGAEVGPSFSRYGGDAENHKFKAGAIAGGFLTYSIVNTFGITGKVLFSQKGTRFSDDGTMVNQTLDYIEVPVIGRFFLNKEGRFRPNVFLGPSFGFLVGVKNKKGEGEAVKVNEAQRDNFSNLDLGITGGLGLNYEFLRETRLLLDARYTHGLSDISEPGVFNNRSLGVTLGMSFGF